MMLIPVADNDRFGKNRYPNKHILKNHAGKRDAELAGRIKKSLNPEIIRIRKTYEVGVYIVHDPNSELGYRIRIAYPKNIHPRYGR